MTVSAREFLQALYAVATPGTFVNISGYAMNGGDKYAKDADGRLIWTDNYASYRIDQLATVAVDPFDRWFTVQPRIEPKRGSEANTAEVVAVFADFDFAESSPGKDPGRAFTNLDDVRRFCVEQVPIAPSAIVASGHGAHAYWFLSEPAAPLEGKRLLSRFNAYLQGRANAVGKDLDEMKDTARVLRLPGSTNWKDTSAPRPVEVIDFTPDRRYGVDDFDFTPEVAEVSINPDTSDISGDDVTRWIGELPAGRDDPKRITAWVDAIRGATPGAPKVGRRPTTMKVLGWLTADAEAGRVDFATAIEAVGREFVALFDGKESAKAEFSKMTVRAIKYRIADPQAKLTHGGVIISPQQLPKDIPTIDALPIQAYRASDLDVLADIPVEFLIRGFLASDTAGMWGGAQKTLKTELQVGMDLSVASGVPFLQHQEFEVHDTGPVLVFVGEGGLAPYMRRVRRIAAAYGLESNPDNYIITGHLGDMSNPEFITQVAETVVAVDPVLVRIDPYYAYHGGDTEAGNLFAQGKLLTRFQTAVAGRTFLLTHHFNESGRGLDLARFTQAGSAQWIDSWVQVVHRETPDPDSGLFWLGLKVGSRQWGERLYEVDVNLGTFDMDTGHHNGVPTWDVRQVDYTVIDEWGRGARKPAIDRRPEIAKILRDEPWTYTRTDLVTAVGGTAETTREHLDALIGVRHVLRADVPYVDSAGRPRRRTVLGFAPEAPAEIHGVGIPIDYPEPPKEES